MASPTRTWISIFLVMAACWYLFFNIDQTVISLKGLNHPMVSPQGVRTELAHQEMVPGLIGHGILLFFFILGTILVMTNGHERPNFQKSQIWSWIGMLGLLLLTTIIHFMLRYYDHQKSPQTYFKLCLGMNVLRMVLLGGILGTGIHVMQNH